MMGARQEQWLWSRVSATQITHFRRQRKQSPGRLEGTKQQHRSSLELVFSRLSQGDREDRQEEYFVEMGTKPPVQLYLPVWFLSQRGACLVLPGPASSGARRRWGSLCPFLAHSSHHLFSLSSVWAVVHVEGQWFDVLLPSSHKWLGTGSCQQPRSWFHGPFRRYET